MGQLEDMSVFTRVVEAGSISKAAQQLNIAKSAVSRRLAELESKLGVQLLVRTTRQSRVTEEGRLYYQDAKRIIQNIEELNERNWNTENVKLSGDFRVAAPLDFSLLHLHETISDFMDLHPDLRLQLDLSDEHVNVVEDGYELAIRITQLKDSSFHARKLATIKHVIAASPDYLRKFGMPTTPEALNQHRFLMYANLTFNNLRFSDTQHNEFVATVTPTMRVNSGIFLTHCALNGSGIVCMPRFIAAQHLCDGTLIPLLEEYTVPDIYLYAMYAYTKYTPIKVRKLIDFLSEKVQLTAL